MLLVVILKKLHIESVERLDVELSQFLSSRNHRRNCLLSLLSIIVYYYYCLIVIIIMLSFSELSVLPKA